MSSPTPSLLGIPLELRKLIYDHLFHDTEVFHLYRKEVYQDIGSAFIPHGSTTNPAIFCTCRQLRDEAGEYRYSNVEVFVSVSSGGTFDDVEGLPNRGKAENMMYFWRFTKDIVLRVPLQCYDENIRVVEELAEFVEKALENGKYLKTLWVVFVRRSEVLPEWYPEAVEALKQMRVQGEVIVRVACGTEYEEDELCSELEDIIKGAKDISH